MKKFFINQWKNFKKYWYFYLLWFFLLPFVYHFAIFGLDLIDININCRTVFYDISFYSFISFGHGVLGCLLLFLSFKLNDLCLYLYSYYIYTGKNNWYKFYNDRKKLHKEEDKIAYKEYLEKNKKED